jgi:hypothetical protein
MVIADAAGSSRYSCGGVSWRGGPAGHGGSAGRRHRRLPLRAIHLGFRQLGLKLLIEQLVAILP